MAQPIVTGSTSSTSALGTGIMAATIGAINLAIEAQTESQINQALSMKDQLKSLLMEVAANADSIVKSGKAQMIGSALSAGLGMVTAGAGTFGVFYNMSQQKSSISARTEIEKSPKAKNLKALKNAFSRAGSPGEGVDQTKINAFLTKEGEIRANDPDLQEILQNATLKQRNKLINQHAAFKDGTAPEISSKQAESDRKSQRATTIEQNIVHPLGKAGQELSQAIGGTNSKKRDAQSTEAQAAQQANQTGAEIIKEVINLLAQANNNLISNLSSLAQAIR